MYPACSGHEQTESNHSIWVGENPSPSLHCPHPPFSHPSPAIPLGTDLFFIEATKKMAQVSASVSTEEGYEKGCGGSVGLLLDGTKLNLTCTLLPHTAWADN